MYVYSPITGIYLKEWRQETPRGINHADAIKEGVENSNDANFIQDTVAGRTDVFDVASGPAGLTLIQNYIFQLRYIGDDYGAVPELILKFYVGGIQRGSTILINADTNGAKWNRQVIFSGINVAGAIWYAGPRRVYVTDGDGGGVCDPPLNYEQYQYE